MWIYEFDQFGIASKVLSTKKIVHTNFQLIQLLKLSLGLFLPKYIYVNTKFDTEA